MVRISDALKRKQPEEKKAAEKPPKKAVKVKKEKAVKDKAVVQKKPVKKAPKAAKKKVQKKPAERLSQKKVDFNRRKHIYTRIPGQKQKKDHCQISHINRPDSLPPFNEHNRKQNP